MAQFETAAGSDTRADDRRLKWPVLPRESADAAVCLALRVDADPQSQCHTQNASVSACARSRL